MPLSIPNPIRLGHSPDPDDAFMFYGLALGHVDTEGLRFEHHLEDIQTLNQRAFEGIYETTAISVHAYAHLADRYMLLNSGASMGVGYGPIVVSVEPMRPTALKEKRIAIPGELTSAFLALKLYIGEFDYIVVPFDQIFHTVQVGKADAGLIIHEGQLTYEREGFYCIIDLGRWWADTHDGLPLPLGVNGIRKDLGPELLRRIDRILLRSIDYGLAHRHAAVEYAMQFGRDLDIQLADQFIGMYVNEWTQRTSTKCKPAIEQFLGEAMHKGLIPEFQIEFVESVR